MTANSLRLTLISLLVLTSTGCFGALGLGGQEGDPINDTGDLANYDGDEADPAAEAAADSDCDGIANGQDPDDDNDGLLDADDDDDDGDGIPDEDDNSATDCGDTGDTGDTGQ